MKSLTHNRCYVLTTLTVRFSLNRRRDVKKISRSVATITEHTKVAIVNYDNVTQSQSDNAGVSNNHRHCPVVLCGALVGWRERVGAYLPASVLPMFQGSLAQLHPCLASWPAMRCKSLESTLDAYSSEVNSDNWSSSYNVNWYTSPAFADFTSQAARASSPRLSRTRSHNCRAVGSD